MKTFIKHDIPSIVQQNDEGGRTYLTPTGNKYPSVTTITSFYTAADIQAWRKRVGEGEANKVSRRASKRGSSFHSLCEDYLKKGEYNASIFDQEMFNSVIPSLDKINNIHCIETGLYSHHLEVAGTVDCIAEYDGVLHVIDFKTSLKPKHKEWISSYFMQASSYAVMFEELTGINVPRIMVIVGVDNHEPQIFQEKRNDWIFKFRDVREQFRRAKGY